MHGHGMHGMMHGKRLEFLSALNLTEAQKAAAKSIFDQAKQESAPVIEQLKSGHEAMEAAVKANKSDAELNQIAASQGTLMGQLAGIHARSFARVYAQLTPEQKAKADELHAGFKRMIQRRMQTHDSAPHVAK